MHRWKSALLTQMDIESWNGANKSSGDDISLAQHHRAAYAQKVAKQKKKLPGKVPFYIFDQYSVNLCSAESC